jgi:hypothetical protein
MRTQTLLHRSTFAWLLMLCGAALAAPESNWPVAPKLIELPTPYGTLAVGDSDYVYEARLKLDGAQVEPLVTGMLSISYAFSMQDAQAALVADAANLTVQTPSRDKPGALDVYVYDGKTIRQGSSKKGKR